MSEEWICRFITKEFFDTKYYCYTYKDLNNTFLNGNGYSQTLYDVLYNKSPSSYSSRLLRGLVDLLTQTAIIYEKTTVRYIYAACIELKVPLVYIMYACDNYSISPPNVSMFVKVACNYHLHIPSAKKISGYMKQFNKFKATIETTIDDAELDMYIAIRKCEKAGTFTAKQSVYYFNRFDEVSDTLYLTINMLFEYYNNKEYVHRVSISRRLRDYRTGKIKCCNTKVLGTILAVFNSYTLSSSDNNNVIGFDYTFTPNNKRSGGAYYCDYTNKPDVLMHHLLHGRQRRLNITPPCCNDKNLYDIKEYKRMVYDILSLDPETDNKNERAFSLFSGIVLHMTTNVSKNVPISTVTTINKPLVRFVDKYKTMTCSYYKEIKKSVFNNNRVKFNFNLQGGEFIIRSRLMCTYNKIKYACNLNKSELYDKPNISNLCGYIRGLNAGIINVHTFRDRMLKNNGYCMKIRSFPAIKLIDTSKSFLRNNIIQRESVLPRTHKTDKVMDNIEHVARNMYPHCERDQELHDLIYDVESWHGNALYGPILGMLKMAYLEQKNNLVKTFTEKMWINQYIIAQNKNNGRNHMCHYYKDMSP